MKKKNIGSFEIKNRKMRFLRCGPVNSQKQIHRDGNVAPESRGIWVFPWPFHDAFFYYHRFEAGLPKKYRLADDEISWANKFPCQNGCDENTSCNLCNHGVDKNLINLWSKERQAWIDRNRKKMIKTVWYNGPIYSRISPMGHVGLFDWYYWDNMRDWIAMARKNIWCYYSYGNGKFFKEIYSVDHMELFIPKI
ncbi:MAG: hypothetical protein WC284_10865 [Candidimonas sp.]